MRRTLPSQTAISMPTRTSRVVAFGLVAMLAVLASLPALLRAGLSHSRPGAGTGGPAALDDGPSTEDANFRTQRLAMTVVLRANARLRQSLSESERSHQACTEARSALARTLRAAPPQVGAATASEGTKLEPQGQTGSGESIRGAPS